MREANEVPKQRKRHTEEFKRSVVEHWLGSRKSARQVAEEFGISTWNLRDWRYRYGPAPKGVDAPVSEDPEAMKEEIDYLRQELARVTHQRDILKKTLGIVTEA
jgi:transposase-like protein